MSTRVVSATYYTLWAFEFASEILNCVSCFVVFLEGSTTQAACCVLGGYALRMLVPLAMYLVDPAFIMFVLWRKFPSCVNVNADNMGNGDSTCARSVHAPREYCRDDAQHNYVFLWSREVTKNIVSVSSSYAYTNIATLWELGAVICGVRPFIACQSRKFEHRLK